MTVDELLKVLKKANFCEVKGRGKGSHKMFKHEDGRITFIPTAKKDIHPKTLNSILKIVELGK